MDIKKDWNKLAIAVITGIIGLLFVIAMFTGTDTFASGFDVLDAPAAAGGGFSQFAMMWLIPAVFFLGVCAYMVLKLLNIDFAKFVILAVGVINLILWIVVLVDAGEFPGISGFELYMTWAPLAIYALLPLIKGVKKVMTPKAA